MTENTYKIPGSMKRSENRKRCPNGYRWDKKKELCIGKTTINVVENLEDIHIKQDKNTMSLETLDKNNGIMKFYSKGILIDQKRIDSKMIKKLKLKKKNFLKKIISISKKINKNPNIINTDKQFQKKINKMLKKNKTRKSGGKGNSSETSKEVQEIVGTDIIMQESMIDQLDDTELNEHISKLANLVESNEYNKKKKEDSVASTLFEYINLLYLFLIIPYEWYVSWSSVAFSISPCDTGGEQLAWSQPASDGHISMILPINQQNEDDILELVLFDAIPAGTPITQSAIDAVTAPCQDGFSINCLMSLQPLIGIIGPHLVCQSTTNPNNVSPFEVTEISNTLSNTISTFYMFDIFGAITLGILNLLSMFINNDALKTTATVTQYIYYLVSIIGVVFFQAGTWLNVILLAIRIIFKLTPTLQEWAKDKAITKNEKDINNEKIKIEEILNKKDNATTEHVTDDDSTFQILDTTIDSILTI